MANDACPSCKTPVEAGFLFCPECGTPIPQEPEPTVSAAGPEPSLEDGETAGGVPLSELGLPGVAAGKSRRFRLVKLARGGGHPVPYDLPESGMSIGRKECDVTFPEDLTVSPRHVFVRPAGEHVEINETGSQNGVFVRIRGEHRLQEGDVFLIGDQFFRISLEPGKFPPEEYRLYAAPKERNVMASLTHLAEDGRDGEVIAIRALPFLVGREDGDLRFGADRFMSRKHAMLKGTDKGLVIEDQGSRNGTYVRRRGTFLLGDGDLFLVGRQLLRVEAIGS